MSALSRLHRLSWLAIGAMAVVLMLPNLAWLWSNHALSTWLYALAVPAALIVGWFALFGTRLWLGCLSLLPFCVLAPIEAFYIVRYGHPSTAEVLATVFVTNTQEVLQFLGNGLWPLVLATVVCLAVPSIAVALCFKSHLQWNQRGREWIVMAVFALPACFFLLGATTQTTPTMTAYQSGVAALQVLETPLPKGYPFGVIDRVVQFSVQWSAMYSTVKALNSFRFHASRVGHTRTRQIYVLVIGESSRRNHWQMFGYERPTNPELSEESNLVLIPHMLTSWPETITAAPLILTRKPITSMDATWKEASILRAMQEAGFETWWISNQFPIGQFDSPISAYSFEAEHVLYVNQGDVESSGNYDQDLLMPLRKAIGFDKRDQFIVLHMMGSHLAYDLRYPPEFERFRPTFSDHSSSAVSSERIRNSYDNTILYTDHVLAQTVDILRNSAAITTLWYESDHGETLPTPTCPKAGHGFGTKYDFQIPAFFWYSDGYANAFPHRLAALRANAVRRTLSANTFESLIDMAGVTFPSHDETWSLFSTHWHYRPRIVNPIWQVDFDKAAFGKNCEIVLPPDVDPSINQ
ncbi:MAG: phosphoethanolamine transferase [Xanthomonadaceae bacterium]|nr:phosphoethanolamine transferase [Xanthomonadaceae bacterium]MDE2084294.1 phosphoethanolamine transferase [Xanthomonadaceae bacterium]MDE2256627.1 phosphoethanolamine transferase [Xanthomonadaceae bacterium]